MTDRFPDLPARMRRLRVDHRGFPVPWFVHWDEHGEPQFPVIGMNKVQRASERDLCWVCGEKLGQIRASVIGPMCAITRTISEPQSHVDCARFSARRCPFLSQPRMGRVPEHKLPEGVEWSDTGIKRNPGVACVWIEAHKSKRFRARGDWLFELGEPQAVEWWCEGREATYAEVRASIDSGLPLLVQDCWKEAPGQRRDEALRELARRCAEIEAILPAGGVTCG
jgi:hypothetical protein